MAAAGDPGSPDLGQAAAAYLAVVDFEGNFELGIVG